MTEQPPHPPALGVPLAVEGLTRDFPVVRALDDVTLDFRAGEVHGIVGENGAGKSTLMNVLAGVLQPTAGRVLRDGRAVRFSSPAEAMRAGISMVHQELNLVEDLTVADNIFLGREKHRAGFVRRRGTRAAARELLDRLGCGVDPGARPRTLPVAARQMVEIAKSLSEYPSSPRDAGGAVGAPVLILDEPTAVLGRPGVRRLFELIGRLRREGSAVIYISHVLPEVLEICDRVTVLRDGRLVTTLPRDALAGPDAEARLSSLMVGRPLADHFPARAAPREEVALEVRSLSSADVADVSFRVRRGEVLGFAGLVGSGRTELAEALFGLRPVAGGQVFRNGRPVRPRSPGQAVRAGIAYVPEDRKGRGILTGRSVLENATLAALRLYARGLIRRRRERAAAREQLGRLRTRYARLGDTIETLSGGNQQKVVLGRWLQTRPEVLLLDEPTRGIDIGAKEEVYRLIAELAAAGMACVLISSELNELLGMCHRIVLMRGGRVAGVLEGEAMTEDEVMLLAAGAGAEKGAASA